MTEERKIVRSGKSSYTLALPITWVRKNKLEKSSKINVTENEIGELVISADPKEQNKKEPVTISTEGKNADSISHEIQHAYLQDAPTIIIESKHINKLHETISTQLKAFIGLDIIDKGKENITIKNFSENDKELSPRNTLKKIDLGIREMFDITEKFFEKGFSKEDQTTIKTIHEQNNRLRLLARKSILKIIENPLLIRTYGTTYHQLTKEKVILNLLMQLSETIKDMGRTLLYLEYTKKETKILEQVFKTAPTDYQKTLGVMRYKNYEDLIPFIREKSKKEENNEKIMRGVENPIMIETITLVLTMRKIIRDLAREIVE